MIDSIANPYFLGTLSIQTHIQYISSGYTGLSPSPRLHGHYWVLGSIRSTPINKVIANPCKWIHHE